MTKQYPYAVYRTAFHGGGLVSRHNTLTGALKAACIKTECTCGCLVAVSLAEAGKLRYAAETHNPYAPAL